MGSREAADAMLAAALLLLLLLLLPMAMPHMVRASIKRGSDETRLT
jgi:hypothetical protein